MQAVFTSAPYRPSASLSGNEGLSIYRGQNLLLRGQLGNQYYGAYTGSRDISEPLPTEAITGTISFNPSSLTVTGSGTAFQDELHANGQIIWCNDEPLSINQIASQTSLTLYRLPTTTGVGETAYKTRNLRALDTKRISLFWGDACKTELGNILAVGDGELLQNGAVLPGDSLTATRRLQIALYDGTTATYDVQDIGFDDVPALTNSDITVVASGGTKNTPAGYYSFMLSYYSTNTDGYSNHTPVLLSGGTAGYQVASANSTFRIDKSADTPPDKATGYIVYATAFGGSSAQSQLNAISGPWYELLRVPFTDFVSDLYAFDYVDFDLSSTLASDDNETPPDADFVSLFTGYVNLISTNGPGHNTAGRETETSPGPLISPMKGDNIDGYAASLRVPTAEGETIIGYCSANGRLFPMTSNTLQASTPTGLPQSPFTLRPFWQRGFASPYALVFADDTLYGFTSKGPYRSIATGDGGEESNNFASSVDAQMAEWNPGYVFVETDPKNSVVCFFHSAFAKNDADYWVTEVYLYSLKIDDWLPPVLLTSDTRDMIVTGAARVHNSLYFVAGGRRESTSDQWATWEFDGGSDDDVDWYLVPAFSDFGAEMTAKVVRKLRPKGKYVNGSTLQIYKVSPDSEINIEDLENGDNPAFEVELDPSAAITQYAITKTNVKGASMVTIRQSGTSGSDQFQEVAMELDITGQLR